MIKPPLSLVSALLCASPLLRADFNPDTWRVRRPIQVAHSTPLSQFTVDPALYRASASSLDDLRILRPGDIETPYVLISLCGIRETTNRPATLLNKAVQPGVGLQAILDLKDHPSVHNRLHIVTPLHNFKETIQLETSDDARTWAMAQPSGLIFDILRDDHSAADLTVEYPDSTRRYVRLTIPGWSTPENLQSVWLADFREIDAVRDIVASHKPTIHESSESQTTELTVDLTFPGRPYDQIDLSIGPGLFSRTVEVATSQDGEHWFARSGGAILRTADAEKLSLETTELADRYLRITVFNADSNPLAFGPVTIRGIRRIVKFPSTQPGTYMVYAGNAAAHRPSYDLAKVLTASAQPEAVSLGSEETNPQYHPPERPWSDRNPLVLNSVLVAAVGLMALIAFKYLAKKH